MTENFNEEKRLDNLSDEKLIEEIRSGKKEAFNILFMRHKKMIFNFSYRFLYISKTDIMKNAEDATSGIFLTVWEKLKGFKKKSTFKTWLYKIALRYLINEKKRIIKELKMKEHVEKKETSFGNYDPIKTVEEARTKKIIEEAIFNLDEKHRLVLILKYYSEMSYDEIADILNIPVGTVKSRYERAIEKIKDKLKN